MSSDVKQKADSAEARVSVIARAVRKSLRDYGHKIAESSLPECVASYVDAALRASQPEQPALAAVEPVVTERCRDCDGYNCDDGCAYPDAKSEHFEPDPVGYTSAVELRNVTVGSVGRFRDVRTDVFTEPLYTNPPPSPDVAALQADNERLTKHLNVEAGFAAQLVKEIGPRRGDQDVHARISELKAAEAREAQMREAGTKFLAEVENVSGKVNVIHRKTFRAAIDDLRELAG